MKKMWPPQDQVFWYTKRGAVTPCSQDTTADVAIIGGGMAGLSAAHAWAQKGKKVILLEQYYCGSGATGKSAGFITPNAELSFTDFMHHYGDDAAKTIWDRISSGVETIKSNIETHQFECEYFPQDTLVLATSEKAEKILETEYQNLHKHGYPALYNDAHSTRSLIGSDHYYGSFGYKNTCGINAYAYCQEMKKMLQGNGVQIFEETPVTEISGNTLKTAHAQITADYTIVCVDHFLPQLGILRNELYHAQTFLMLSQELTDKQISTLFPQSPYLVWDTELVYNYFRLTPQKRLLLGGGSVWSTYASKAHHDNSALINKLTHYFNTKFPQLSIQFEYSWPGLIGISKDIAPIAGPDANNPHTFYIAGAAGLPIAAALGRYSAEYVLEGNRSLENYFSPYRKFPIGGIAQSILGTKLSFALSNFFTQKSIV